MSEHKRTLAEPAFPDDNGLTDPILAGRLGHKEQVLAVLGAARIYVPVVAVLTSDAGLASTEGDKNADMAAVLMRGADGRQALLAFTSVATMQQWRADARPVPVYGRDAARAALAEGASAILLDLATPSFVVVETDDVEHLAAEDVLVQTAAGTAWVKPGTRG